MEAHLSSLSLPPGALAPLWHQDFPLGMKAFNWT